MINRDGIVFRVNINLFDRVQNAAIYYLVGGSDTKRDSRHEGD